MKRNAEQMTGAYGEGIAHGRLRLPHTDWGAIRASGYTGENFSGHLSQTPVAAAEKPAAQHGEAPRVTLSMFSPKVELCETSFATHYVDQDALRFLKRVGNKETWARSEARKKSRYEDRHGEDPNYDNRRSAEVKKLKKEAKKAINDKVYKTIMEDFAVPTVEEAQAFFKNQMRVANEAILKHGALVFPPGEAFQPTNEAQLSTSPADLVEWYVDPDTDPQLRRSYRNQFLLGHIAGEIDVLKRGGDETMGHIQELLNEKFFAGKRGQTNRRVRYGVFDSQTNELQYEDEEKTKPKLYEEAPPEVAEGEHIKTINMKTRTQESTGTEAIAILDIKDESDGARKGVRKALGRESGEVLPEKDIRDTHRMTIITLGDKDNAEAMTGEVLDLFADHENHSFFENDSANPNDGLQPGMPVNWWREDETKTDESGKAASFNRRRIFVQFHEQHAPVEIFIQTLDEYLTGKLEVGNYLPKKGEYDGAGHSLLIGSRERSLTPIFFDEETFGDLPLPHRHDKVVPFPPLAAEAHVLLDLREMHLEDKRIS